nr:acetyltransferase [Vibrio cholerae]
MRCQPLRRALVSLGKIQHLAFKLHNLAFGVFLMLIC